MRVRRARIGERYNERATSAVGDYVDNATDPATEWERPTAAAEDKWDDGVTEAARLHKFSGGVHAAGDEKYKVGVATKGSRNYAAGIRDGTSKYVEKMTPFLNALEALDLPPRGLTIEENIERALIVGRKLQEVKRGLG